MPERCITPIWRASLTAALPWLTLAWVALMLVSLYWPVLDQFVIGSWHRQTGLDFFSVPRAWENLLAGRSIFDTNASSFGPYAAWYPYHPLVAVAIGSWTRQLAPLPSYLAFVVFSLVILAFSGWILARQTADPLLKRLSYACLICSLPIYLMLFIGQMHVFTVLSLALVLAGLLQLSGGEPRSLRQAEWQIGLGLLASLFTKPLVILFLPTLLLVRETRRATLGALGFYAVVSAIFLLVPALNPGGLNQIHWTNIAAISQSTNYMAILGVIAEKPMSDNPLIFSLPAWCDHLCQVHFSPQLFKLPLLVVSVLSLVAAWQKDRAVRLQLATTCVILAVCAYYLGYPCVWEYHYTTLLPGVVVLAMWWDGESDPRRRRSLGLALLLGATLFLPTPYFLFRDNPPEFMTVCRATRILPVAGMYIVLLADAVLLLRQPLPAVILAPKATTGPNKKRREPAKALPSR